MKIKLIGAIRRVNGVFHEFGAIVDVDDDLANRMLAGGSAVGPDDPIPVPNGGEVYELPKDQSDADVDDMTVDQLKDYAEEQGIDLGDATRKADILDVIKAAE